jgi:hypothetical protein
MGRFKDEIGRSINKVQKATHKDKLDGKNVIEFKIPELGKFSVGHDGFKYIPPFAHYSDAEKKKYRKERAARPKYTVWHNGGGIGSANTIEEGIKIIRDYAKACMKYRFDKTLIGLSALQTIKNSMEQKGWLDHFQIELES